MLKYTTSQIIQKFQDAHGNKYDYSNFQYSGTNVKFLFTCPIHGEFELNLKVIMIKIIKGGSYLSYNSYCRKRGVFRYNDGCHDTGLRIIIKYYESF